MRTNAQTVAAKRRLAGLGAAAAAVATIAALGAPSAMAASTVTIATSFENSPISLNTSDAIGFKLTNNTGASQTVTFTDTLPAGVTLDNPVGTTSTNGTGACSLVSTTASPGGGSVTTSVTVPSETASGTVCTISYGVVAGTASTSDAPLHDAYSDVSASSGTVSTPTPGSLVVLSSPALTLTAPSNGRSFYLGQVSDATFACAATDALDSVASFFATDDEGNQIGAGAPLDTVDPGSHTLDVNCYSATGGGVVTQSVNYTVGSYTLKAVRAAKATGSVSFKTLVPAGRISAEVILGKKVIGTKSLSVRSRRTASITVNPTTAGKNLLAAIRGKTAKAELQVSFKPQAIGTGDQQITPAGATVVTRNIRLQVTHQAK